MHFKLPKYEYESKRITVHKPLKKGAWNTLAEIEGSGIIKHIWITFPTIDRQLSRKTILRMYWDDEENPSVEAPLGDFFGVPLGLTGTEYQLNSYFLQVAPHNGLNCYFAMPFARKARIEIWLDFPISRGGFYFQCDYEKCLNELPEEWREWRFHAKYRMESPTEKYGHRYLVLDAEGEGFLIGTTFGISVLEHLPDAWYHGGGDLITIDGETNPHILHGIGAEDFFGHSWGTDSSSGLYLGNPYIQKLATDDKNGLMNLALYRFFVQDPIRFRSSISVRLGAMGAMMSSVAYWYQKERHREFFTLPFGDNLLQSSDVPRGRFDAVPKYTHEWMVYGPIRDEEPNKFEDEHPLEKHLDLSYESVYRFGSDGKQTMQVKWQALSAPRGFLDFHVRMRPEVFAIQLQTHCYGYALGYVTVPEDFQGGIRIGYDDQIKLWLNDELMLEGCHDQGFAHQTVPVKLSKGTHKILLKLSNTPNDNFRAWVSHFAFVDQSGEIRDDLLVRKTV